MREILRVLNEPTPFWLTLLFMLAIGYALGRDE